jgi:hypothetical protein
MRRRPEQPERVEQPADDAHRQAVAAQMNPGFFERQRHIETVVDQELAFMRLHQLLYLTCKSEKILPAEVALSQLDRNLPGLQRLLKE